MRMTLHTDYALRMLIYLAMRDGRPCTVNDVAQGYGISRNHLLKVALGLARMGLVKTTRGRSGGLSLARRPGEINLGAVIRGMEEDFAVVECLQAGGGACAISPTCRLKGIVSEALEAYLAVFDRHTLADLSHNGGELATLLALDEAI